MDASAAGIVGTWRLLAYEVEVRATGRRFPAMGERPSGYTIFSPEGRVWFMLTGDGREPGDSDAEMARLLESLIAYTGRYRIEGDDWITEVDVAWNPAWVGTGQRRQFALDGDRLEVLTPWRVMPNWADEGESRSIITFERVTVERVAGAVAPE
ncbi:lipocalin-like domain-containing protein [Luteimonas kalidii]|uniref:Lipocalin-like domain-containing protein n=1 Tax=Luteimonas kalidii TaxID=3042025 RepID=A0ABT6JS66_9GAMM|nr:lipocalin-like domain-containing protein [Luteimonas kalidii]MDH5833447.1 lipocalin-like domain-containing protein [Luteimonas kalidii]